MKKRQGFTLLELLIVVIIIGILATFAIPQFLTSVEKAKIGKAKHAMGLIVQAEKMYWAEHNNLTSNLTDLHNYVELDQVQNDQDWNYTVTPGTGGNFSVEADRRTGKYASDNITIDQSGNCDGDHELRGPSCGGS